MKTVSIISGSVVIAAAISINTIIPASVTLNVGDDGSCVNKVGSYGYGKSMFSLRPKKDAKGDFLKPSAFWIGPGEYHLLIWHNDRINSMTHFRHEQLAPFTYGEWHDIKQVDTFTVSRPSTMLFFVVTPILAIGGYFLSRFRRTSIALFVLLIFFVFFIVLGFSLIAETIATLPLLAGIGWIAAPIFGSSLALKRNASSELV
ncbi:hypothetical protein [Gimesia aquarii]|uniref:Uncharacterized protein n=1 Tax=Gimesia aquarii TaxID=2527964 RepID=A0A517X308_9PLAN|nr:hypothetical protein [Gimesia aquarii]QDU11869.1 hypothetical protein V202x_52940 [Gimesia aquarii]